VAEQSADFVCSATVHRAVILAPSGWAARGTLAGVFDVASPEARWTSDTQTSEGTPWRGDTGGVFQASGMSRPKASRVIASGSGPPRRPVSRLSMAVISSADSSKSNTAMFSAMRLGLVDFGITDRPC
jgi:hypothetical protein